MYGYKSGNDSQPQMDKRNPTREERTRRTKLLDRSMQCTGGASDIKHMCVLRNVTSMAIALKKVPVELPSYNGPIVVLDFPTKLYINIKQI